MVTLVDCHMHMILDGGWWRDAIARHAVRINEAAVRKELAAWQAAGFTYLRDGGDKWGAGAFARSIAPEYGITYRSPLSPLHKRGHYGGFIGTAFDNETEFAALVASHKRGGADFIKIMISGLMDFNVYGRLSEESLSSQEIRQLISIVKDTGMSVMIHGNGPQAVIAAALAGADSIEHGAYLNNEALHAMAENGTVWVPTLSTVANPRGTGRFDDAVLTKILESAQENVYQFAHMGGLIAPGSDAGAWAVPHGCTTEQALLHDCLGDAAEDILQKGIARIQERF